MKKCCVLVCTLALGFFPAIENVMARSNILSGGLSLSYDFQDRDSEDSDLTDSGDDYERVAITPMLRLVSSSQRDSLELSASQGFKYDLDESESDWDTDLFAGYDRALSRAWNFRVSNSFLRSDFDSTDDTVAEQDISVAPELSSDIGRRRYWRNTFALATDYTYRQDSLNSAAFDWVILRNDDSDDGIEEYDRYTGTLSNAHRFNADWKTTVNMTIVRGDYEEDNAGDLSEDLWEYRPGLIVENNMIERNPLSISYDYIGIQYDETEQSDSDIHQIRLNWRRDFSPRFYTNVGAGPTYEESEGRDGSWGANGIVEANYQVRRGSYRFVVEKSYDVDNFSGTDERGVVDTWDAIFSFNRSLTQYLDLNGSLTYYYEDRTEFVTGSGNTTNTDEINTEQFKTKLGVSYKFWRYYSVGASYTYLTQDSDQIEDNYDDHRILLTLSWNRELMRW